MAYEPETDEKLTDDEKEEMRQNILENEDDYIAGLLAAAKDIEDDVLPIEIRRKGKLFFTFHIHSLDGQELTDIRKKYTKYTKNRRNGVRVAEDIDNVKFRASLIYNSTTDEDKKKLWDNQRIWNGLEAQGKVIINALDVIQSVLLPGEIDWIMDQIDDFNGFNNNELQATAKN